MSLLISIAVIVQIVTAVAIIVLVLLQHGKGADLGAAFGSGASGSLFGASGSANFLSRTTAVCAVLFFVSTIMITIGTGAFRKASVPTGGVLDTVNQTIDANQTSGTQNNGAGTQSGQIPR